MAQASRVSRMVRVLTTLQSGQSFGADALAKMLGTSRRTIFRDLKSLQKAGVPCRFDRKTNSYAIESDFFLPSCDLSSKEALSVLIMLCKARHAIPLPFKESALLAALKIENNLPSSMKKACNSILRNVSVRCGPVPASNFDETFAILQKALCSKNIVEVKYVKTLNSDPVEIEVYPLHLIQFHYTWYVLVKCEKQKRVKCINVNHIVSVKTLDKCFVLDNKFDADEFVGKAWGIKREKILYNVKLHFDPDVAMDVAMTQWHSTQKVAVNPDASVILEFRIDGLDEIVPWILSYGDKIKVFAPQQLATKIARIYHRAAQNNPL
jgi:proteasome accessory factor B